MVSIITLFSAVQKLIKVIGKVKHNPELENLAIEMKQGLHSPSLVKYRAKELYDKLNKTYNDLPLSDRQEFQNILSQSCVEQGIAAPFDANGNLDIHFDDFLAECENLAEMVGDAGEILGNSTEVVTSVGEGADIASDATEIVSDGAEVISDVADSVSDEADSIWDFISSLFT